MPNTNYFKLLNEQLIVATELSKQKNAKGFLGQEILRFHSIAGTLLANFSADKTASVNERYITHLLIRSLLENYFKIIFIFKDITGDSEQDQFGLAVNSFKMEYKKLVDDLNKEDAWKPFMDQNRNSFQVPNDDWVRLPKLMNNNDLLDKVENDNGDKLKYLYILYRITSFDVHGNSLKVFFDETFDIQCGFPIIDIRYAINLIASSYVEYLDKYKLGG